MYQDGVALISYDILDKDFKIDTRFYSAYEFDSSLNLIIKDYDKTVEWFNKYLFDFFSKIFIGDIKNVEKEQKIKTVKISFH